MIDPTNHVNSDAGAPTPAPKHPTPPRGPKLSFIAVVCGIALIALLIGVALGPLVKNVLQKKGPAADGANGTWYISQMHPWIIQPNPGQCPICGMDLVPVNPDRFTGEIAIDPVMVQNMGVRIAKAQYSTITQSLRTVGTVQVDESLVTDVVQRFAGWIEAVYVTAQWNAVEAGSPLFRIYSPAVYAAEQEYLIARSGRTTNGGETLFAAAKKKVELLGLPQDEIARLEREGTASQNVTITSPASGYIWQKNINQGSEITAKTVAFRIADLSKVWVEATLYEDQLTFIDINQPARIQLNYGEKTLLNGTISYIYPSVDQRTRAVRARFVFANHIDENGPQLKPGMFATVHIDKESEKFYVIIPSEAVIGTGDRHVVFVSSGRGKFAPHTVELGPKSNNGMTAIVSGIEVDDQVVISGQFLLDSESKMRDALARVMKGDLASEQLPTKKSAPVKLVPLDEQTAASWRLVILQYLQVHDDLYENRTKPLKPDTTALKTVINEFISHGKSADPHFHHRFEAVAALAEESAVLDDTSLDTLRPGFGALSITLNQLLKQFGQPSGLDQPLVGMRCSMAKGIPEKGMWIQAGPVVKNPYYGAASDMRACMADNWSIPMLGDSETKTSPVAPDTTQPKTPTPATSPDATTTSPANAAVTPAPAQSALTHETLIAYQQLHQAIYDNDANLAKKKAEHLMHAFHGLGQAWATSMDEANAIVTASDIELMRKHFGHIGVTFKSYFAQHGTHQSDIYVMRCGMARDIADKGVWIQIGELAPMNPYFGSTHTMGECAKQIWSVNHTGLQVVKE